MVQTTSEPRMPIGMSRLGILRLLRRRRNRVESDIGKKDRCRSRSAMPPQPKFPWPSEGGMKGCQFMHGHCRMLEQVIAADNEEDPDDRQLDESRSQS